MLSTHLDLVTSEGVWASAELHADRLSNAVFGECVKGFGITARKVNVEGEVCLVLDGRAKTGNLSGGPMWSVHVRLRSQSTQTGPIKGFSVLSFTERGEERGWSINLSECDEGLGGARGSGIT